MKYEFTEFDKMIQLQGFERVSILLTMLHETLGSAILDEDCELEFEIESLHPCIYDERAVYLLAKSCESLCELYQHMGNWGFNAGES